MSDEQTNGKLANILRVFQKTFLNKLRVFRSNFWQMTEFLNVQTDCLDKVSGPDEKREIVLKCLD